MSQSAVPVRLCVLFVVAVFSLGCAGKTSSAPTEPEIVPPSASATTSTAIQDSTVQPEEFDPAKWSPPETGPSPEAARVLATLPEPSQVVLPGNIVAPAASRTLGGTDPASRGSDCREVQILASTDARAAQEVSRSASRALVTPSRVVETQGLYRVRLGGCLDERAARELQQRAVTLGYEGAFLVTTVKQAP